LVELDHSFTTGKPADYNWQAILDLERLIPCVEGGQVIERTSPEAVKAEIKVKMGAMSMTFKGTVEVAERDDDAHRADGGGTIHTAAQITGKAASMGEGVVVSVLDALITDFTQKLAAI
jgi:carbon monoxide dehydrogenase subunit G